MPRIDKSKLKPTKKLTKYRSRYRKIQVAKQICNEYAKGESTIASCCLAFGASQESFNLWATDWQSKGYENPPRGCISEITDLYKKAKEIRFQANLGELKKIALSGLKKKAVGYEYEETHTDLKAIVKEDGTKVLVPQAVKKILKKVQPSDTVLIFLAKNTMPETFKDVHVQKHEGQITSIYSNLSDKELDKFILDIEKKTEVKKIAKKSGGIPPK